MQLFLMLYHFLLYFPCQFRWYRKWKGGNWKYVTCKYPAPINSCWIHNEEAFWFELIDREENY